MYIALKSSDIQYFLGSILNKDARKLSRCIGMNMIVVRVNLTETLTLCFLVM